jgi:hypothetical protein
MVVYNQRVRWNFFYIDRTRVDSSFNPVVGGQDCCWRDDQLEKIKIARAVLHCIYPCARSSSTDPV